MVDTDREVALTVGNVSAVGSVDGPDGEPVRTEDSLGSEVARAQSVCPGQDERNLVVFERWGILAVAGVRRLDRLVQHRPDISRQRVVPRQRVIGALEHDNGLLTGECFDDRGLRERPDHVHVDRSDLRVIGLTQIVDGGFDVLGGRPERDEHHVGVIGAVLGDEPVRASGEASELYIGLFEEPEDVLGEVVPACNDAVHVVLLVLDGSEKHGVREIDHRRNTASRRPEEHALGFGGALDDVIRCAEEVSHEAGLMLVEGAFEVRGEESVLRVDSRVQGEFGDAADDERLVGYLLCILPEEHHPTGVERCVDVVVAAVDVERMLREGAGCNLDDHGRELPRGVVVLLEAVEEALAGREVHDSLAGHR